MEPLELKALIRAKAVQHFGHRAATAAYWGGDPKSAAQEAKTGISLVDFVLALAPGELADVAAWCHTQGIELTQLTGLPYVMGSLGLLDMVFSHPTLGELPVEVVKPLWSSGTPQRFRDQEIRACEVLVGFRRRKIEAQVLQ